MSLKFYVLSNMVKNASRRAVVAARLHSTPANCFVAPENGLMAAAPLIFADVNLF